VIGVEEGVLVSSEVKTERRRDRLSHHIGFAERWLTRAKGEVARGELSRGQLTLLLAEAEIHHARAAEETPAAASPRPHPLMMVAGTALCAAVLLAGLSAALPRSEVSAVLSSSPPVIRFKQPVGSTLVLLPMVAAPAAAPEVTSLPPRGPVPAAAPRAAPRRTSVRAAVMPPTLPAPAQPAAPVVLVSDGDLIDLVLAAERSLRGEKQ